MRKRFLNKKMSPFLDQAFPENILPHLRIKNKTKKLLSKRKLIPTHSKIVLLSAGKSRAMKKLETEIIKQFSRMSIIDGTTAMRSTDLFFSNSFSSTFKVAKVGVVPIHRTGNASLGLHNLIPSEQVISPPAVLGQHCVPDLMGTFYPPHLDEHKGGVQKHNFISKTQAEETKTKDIVLSTKSSFPPHFSTKTTLAQSASQQQYAGYFLFSLNQLRNEMMRKTGAKNYSQFKMQLRERRKLSVFFGNLCKRDLRRTINKLNLYRGKANENLLMLLETRLDVALHRCFFFTTILSARQYVNHGKIRVNGKTVTRPSYQLHPGDIISVSNHKDKECNVGKYKNPVYTNLLIKQKLSLQKTKQYLKNVKQWRFMASPFLMQLFSKIQLLTLCVSTPCLVALNARSAPLRSGGENKVYKQSLLDTKYKQNKAKKSGFVSQHESYDTCFITPNHPEFGTDLGLNKEHNPFSSSMKKHCCLTSQDTSNFPKFSENVKLSLHKKVYDPFFGGHLNSICEEFAQDVCTKTANIIKKNHRVLTQSGKKIEASPKAFFFSENTKFYNLLLYLLIKQNLSLKEQHFPPKGGKRSVHSFRFSGEVVKKMKTLHFEISHKSLSAIFLYWPQKLYFPAFLDLDLIRKSFK